MSLLEIDSIDCFYGDFQALFDVSIDGRRGRDGGDHRCQRRRQIDAARRRGRNAAAVPPARCASTGGRSAGFRRTAASRQGSRSSRKGAASSRASRSRRTFASARTAAGADRGASTRCTTSSRPRCSLEPVGRHALRRRAADVRDRARADGEPAADPPRRALPRPRPRDHQDDLRDGGVDLATRAPRSCSSNRTSARRSQLPTAPTACSKAASRCTRRRAELTRERVVEAYFGVH